MPKENVQENIRAKLVEYQSSQSSAQHHDSLVWTSRGMIWSAELILLGFVIQSIDKPQLKHSIIATCILALILIIYLWITSFSLRNIVNQKYDRCKEIEEELELKQHLSLKNKKNLGTISFSIVMSVYLATWIVVLVTVIF